MYKFQHCYLLIELRLAPIRVIYHVRVPSKKPLIAEWIMNGGLTSRKRLTLSRQSEDNVFPTLKALREHSVLSLDFLPTALEATFKMRSCPLDLLWKTTTLWVNCHFRNHEVGSLSMYSAKSAAVPLNSLVYTSLDMIIKGSFSRLTNFRFEANFVFCSLYTAADCYINSISRQILAVQMIIILAGFPTDCVILLLNWSSVSMQVILQPWPLTSDEITTNLRHSRGAHCISVGDTVITPLDPLIVGEGSWLMISVHCVIPFSQTGQASHSSLVYVRNVIDIVCLSFK